MRVLLSRSVTCSDIRLRGAVLMPLCALAVHQLRFYVVFGSHAPAVLAREGHSYLSVAEPVAVLLAALGLGWFVGRVALEVAGRAGVRRAARAAVARSWLVCALVLFSLYCAQELLEGFFSPGHPAGIAGVLGQGGWTAAPISLLVGAVLAMTLRLAHRLLETTGRRARPLWRSASTTTVSHPEPRAADWRLDPRAGVTAGRAPPRAFLPSLI